MKQFILSAVISGWTALLSAQAHHTMTDRIIQQLKTFPQEKTYIHTDGTNYAPGDRVWMKVYVVNALSHEPAGESRYVYVDMTAPDGTVAGRVKIIRRNGVFAGYIDIPATAAGGKYRLRSYTELMNSVSNYESVKPIYVGGKGKSGHVPGKNIPTAETETPVLQYTREGNNLVITADLPGDSLYLLAHCRAYPFFFDHIGAGRPVVLHSDSIPQGIVSLLLIDNRLNIIAERLLLSDNGKERCRLDISTDKEAYAANEAVQMRIALPDLHPDERADISVAVGGTLAAKLPRPSSILAHLFLASDIEGGMDEPERYYGNTEKTDALLATKRWARYDFAKVLKGEYAVPDTRAETSQCISGEVRRGMRRRPAAGADVSIISPQAGFFATTKTDAEGKFVFTDMDFPESTQYVLRATDAKGKEHVELIVDEKDYPGSQPAASEESDDEGSGPGEVPTDILTGELTGDGILLGNVEVTGTRRNSASEGNVYAQMADVSFGLHKIEELGATCLHELLRRIPGVIVRQNLCYIRTASSIYSDNPAAIAVDGIFLDSDYDLDIIQMQDVARVDVFKTGTTVIWGSRGGSGVISVTTKSGNYTTGDTERLNQKRITPLGYQKPADFFHQSGIRKTLYWNPDVKDNTLEFTAAGRAGTCLIVIEGVTTEGRLIHEEKEINVFDKP